MKNTMIRHIIIALAFGYLTTYLLIYGLPDDIPESHMSESINAVLLKGPQDPKNRSCEVQIIISIHMNPSFDVDNMDKFWVLDEVYDPTKRSNQKIISPYLIMVSRGEPIVMYPLQYLKSVTEEELEKDPSDEKEVTELPPILEQEDDLLEFDLRRKRSHHLTSLRSKSKGSRTAVEKRQNVNGETGRNDASYIHGKNDVSNLGLVRIFDPTVINKTLELSNYFKPERPVHKIIKTNQEIKDKLREKLPQKPSFEINSNIHKIKDDIVEKLQANEHNNAFQHNQDLKRLENSNLKYNKKYQDDYENRNYLKAPEQNINNAQVGPTNREKYFPREFENNEHYESGFQNGIEYESPRRDMPEFDKKNEKNIYNYDLQAKYIPVENTNRKNYYMEYANHENIELQPKYISVENANRKNYYMDSANHENHELQSKYTPVENTNRKNYYMDSANDENIELQSKYTPVENTNRKNYYMDSANDENIEQQSKYTPVENINRKNYYMDAANHENIELQSKYTPVENTNRKNYYMDAANHENIELQSKYTPVENINGKNYYVDSANHENSIKKFQNEKEYENENYRTDNHKFINSKEPINEPNHSCYSQPEMIDYEPGNEYLDYLNKPDYKNNMLGQPNIESFDSIVNRHINQNLEKNLMDYKNYYKMHQPPIDSKYYTQDRYHQDPGYDPDFMSHLLSYHPKRNFHRSSPMRRVKNKPRMKRALLNPDNIEEVHTEQLAQKQVNDALKMYNLKNFEINDEASCDTCGGKNKETTESPGPSFCPPLVATDSKDSKLEDFSLKINDEIPCDTCGGKNKKTGGKPLPGGLESSKVEDVNPKNEDNKNDKLEKKSLPKTAFPPDFHEIKIDKNKETSLTNNIHNLSKMHLSEISSDFYLGTTEKADLKLPSGFMPLDLHSSDESSCDTCGGKNKKPGGKTLPGGLDTDKIQDFHIKIDDESSCDTCGGKNKQPSEKPFRGSLDFPGDFHLPFDIYGDHLKNLGVNTLHELEKGDLKVSDEASCDTCGGKNKKPDPKPLPDSLKAQKLQDSHLKFEDEVPCDTCGGKNKKPDGKPFPGGPKSEHIVEKNNVFIPCERCKGHDNCNDDTFVSETCGCLGNPDVCNCEVGKGTRDSKPESSTNKSYSVFKMNTPVPVLTTKLRIFRRRRNTWWRIVPIITLNSMSGIFANENISVVFTSHVDILRMEKSLGLLNSKLAIPKTQNPTQGYTLKEYQDNIRDSVLLEDTEKDISIRDITNSLISKLKKVKVEGAKKIEGLGNFPSSGQALEKCPHKDKDLCLNIRDEKVPEFSIKIKIPFRENAFLVRDKYFVKIARIVTDATTKDALQISVDVINKGMNSQEFLIFIGNCEQSFGTSGTSSTKKLLLPNVGQTVTFLLPFIRGSKKKGKFRCDVVVKAATGRQNQDLKVGVVAKRSMDIQIHSRCFCVWRCQCHCMSKLETFINYNVCETMSRKAQDEAGLLYNCPPGNEKHDKCITDLGIGTNDEEPCDFFCKLLSIFVLILWLLLFLGILKAVLGLCIKPIARFGFDTLQPGRKFECTSKKRIFCINLFFFIIFLFAFWCKCFRPKPEDLLAASTEWICRPDSDCSSQKKQCDGQARLVGGQDQKYNERFLQTFGPLHENGLFSDEKPDDEESTAFILEVLEESKTSLSKMMSQAAAYRQNIEESTEDSVELFTGP
ncbi:uncharacterized protein LOC6499890 isoform X3 [Drosophila ananassae]|uniref:uncharacterized protein LOC6499890 isoform X3 n=1 Tax=Drosophila ananassae TaxID=7217 RepID=UPI001CFF9EFD|nr:uncharacterized protein LOC6499890 isoform X3 [Drosophila ananassae]